MNEARSLSSCQLAPSWWVSRPLQQVLPGPRLGGLDDPSAPTGQRLVGGTSSEQPPAEDRIEGWLNDKLLIDHRDIRFTPDRLELCTKADSTIAFDDFVGGPIRRLVIAAGGITNSSSSLAFSGGTLLAES